MKKLTITLIALGAFALTACGGQKIVLKLGDVNPAFAGYEGTDIDPYISAEEAAAAGLTASEEPELSYEATGDATYDEFFLSTAKMSATVKVANNMLKSINDTLKELKAKKDAGNFSADDKSMLEGLMKDVKATIMALKTIATDAPKVLDGGKKMFDELSAMASGNPAALMGPGGIATKNFPGALSDLGGVISGITDVVGGLTDIYKNSKKLAVGGE